MNAPASSIDNQSRQRAALYSLIISVIVLALKSGAYFYTHSAAVLSDALESIVNVVAAIAAMFVIHYVSQPADEDHPYGHGKLEFFSAAFEGGLIFAASLMIVIESIKSLTMGEGVHELETGMVLIALASLGNVVGSIYLKKVAEKEKSEALKASAAHLMSDVYTTVGVLIGLFLVKVTGLTWLDPLFALAVGVHLTYEGYKIVRRSVGALIDETDTETLKELAAAFEKSREPGIIDIHQIKVIRSGPFHHIDAHLVVPEYWKIAEAHEFCDSFEAKVVKAYPFDGEIAFHLDPCERIYCKLCSVETCPIRAENFEKLRSFTPHSLVLTPQHLQQEN